MFLFLLGEDESHYPAKVPSEIWIVSDTVERFDFLCDAVGRTRRLCIAGRGFMTPFASAQSFSCLTGVRGPYMKLPLRSSTFTR